MPTTRGESTPLEPPAQRPITEQLYNQLATLLLGHATFRHDAHHATIPGGLGTDRLHVDDYLSSLVKLPEVPDVLEAEQRAAIAGRHRALLELGCACISVCEHGPGQNEPYVFLNPSRLVTESIIGGLVVAALQEGGLPANVNRIVIIQPGRRTVTEPLQEPALARIHGMAA